MFLPSMLENSETIFSIRIILCHINQCIYVVHWYICSSFRGFIRLWQHSALRRNEWLTLHTAGRKKKKKKAQHKISVSLTHATCSVKSNLGAGGRFVPVCSATHNWVLTMNMSGEKPAVKSLKTNPCMLILPLFFCSTPVFHFGEAWRNGSEERKAGKRA